MDTSPPSGTPQHPDDAGRHRCPRYQRENLAHVKLESMLIRAFPGTADRSDMQSDYFDFTWIVTSRH